MATELQSKLGEKSEEVAALKTDIDNISDALEELKAEDENLGGKASSFVEEASKLAGCVLAALDTCNWDRVAPLPPWPHEELAETIKRVEEQALTFEAAEDTEELAKLQQELAELSDRETLHRDLDGLLAEKAILGRIENFNQCVDDTQTKSISNLSSRLTKDFVTESLWKAFETELEAMGVKRLKLQVAPAGTSLGVTYHHLEFKSHPKVAVANILSEGEHRCAALASFFAELATATHKSGIVFDDPTSSLDHAWRNYIVERLVKEAKSRQVIIFTHDMVFLVRLLEYMQKQHMNPAVIQVERSGVATGIYCEGPPIAVANIKARIGHLKKQCQKAEDVYRREPKGAYESCAKPIYGQLRETWERAIEEVVLNEVVVRLGEHVQTKRLQKVTDLTQKDYEKIDYAMTKCSRFIEGHDQAAAVNEPVPEPSEIRGDINDLADFVSAVRTRRNK